MSSRDTILTKVRSALKSVPEKSAYPEYDPAVFHSRHRG